MTIAELQQVGPDDEVALAELGRRVLNFDFCLPDDEVKYCYSCDEIRDLRLQLEQELPYDCPHCGKLVDADPADYPTSVVTS